MQKLILYISSVLILGSCNTVPEPITMSDETWQLGWRMIENKWLENPSLAEAQFDSLLNSGETISERFLIEGLVVKSEVEKQDEILEILAKQPNLDLAKICNYSFAQEYKPCSNYSKEEIENEELQLKLIKMFVDDQAIRGNVMDDIIVKYNVDTTGLKTAHDWSNPDEVNMDEIIRNKLKSIINEHGFPTKKLVGRDAMRGVFLIIQHADGDTSWQRAQLPKLEAGTRNGEFSKVNYAYLFDRIKVNSGQPQSYGSQFEHVDRQQGIAELRETEEIESLDQRRKEMGMMPIETYRRLMLRN